ncbi:MAG: TIGR02391 family protein [Candidatus Aminicenantes bacterium]|nr:MAG: TIGR02391 family protein [Candidatus Aminicenantes bacterium]
MNSIPMFYYIYCRNGHMLYSPTSRVTEKHCKTCGETFLNVCENCGSKIHDTFRSIVYTSSGTPIKFPNRPDFCPECGERYPWQGVNKPSSLNGFWDFLHPSVTDVARKRFEDGHYADSVESAFKALNKAVKDLVKKCTGKELDGASLMRKALSPNNPVIVLDDLSKESGRNVQQGYMDLFAGAMSGIRNPKAHDNIDIDEVRAMHHLFLASLLFSKLDERP